MNEPTPSPSIDGEINHGPRKWPGIVSGASCVVLAAALLAFSAAILWQRIELIDVLVLRSMVRTLCWVVLPLTGLVLLVAGVRVLRSARGMITALLIAVLIVPSGVANGQQSAPPPPPPEEKAASIVEAFVMAIIVAIVGYTLIRILIKVCNKCLPPAKEPPPKPPRTNGSPASAFSPLPLAGTLSVTNLAAWDVTAWATNADWEDPDGNYFTVFFTNRIEAAANASFTGNTESITLYGWVSTNWLEVLVLDSRLSPVATNLSPRSTVPIVESGLAGGPQQFFRIARP